MHAHYIKTKKLNFKCHAFKAQWSVNCSVVQLDGKAMCLLCSETIAMLKGIQNTSTLQYKGLITISPAHRQAMVRKIRKFKIQCLIVREFLYKN